jgi:S1-C subfamily serine protease
MDEAPAPAWDRPARQMSVTEPTPQAINTGGRSRTWRAATIIVLVVLFAVCGTGLAVQQSRLSSTRSALAATKASVNAQGARLSTLETSASSQQQSLASLSAQLTTAKTDLGSTQTELRSTQSGLLSAQTRLQADEKQLNLTTSQLSPDLPTLAAKVSPSVVLIACTTATGLDTGTGFALALPASAGFATTVITAAHVINGCTNQSDGSTLALIIGRQTVDAQIRLVDATNDVAILDTTAKIPVLDSSGPPVVGEFLMAVGHPLSNFDNNITTGNVSDVYPTYFLDSAPISSGNSGGPVVDRSGKVVGIVDASQAPGDGTPIVENINISLRLSTLCLQLLNGTSCDALH